MSNRMRSALILVVLATVLVLEAGPSAPAVTMNEPSEVAACGWLLLVHTLFGAIAWGFQAAFWNYSESPLPTRRG